MGGFSAALNQLCAGKSNLEAALAAFQHEPFGDWNAFQESSLLIESAWRSGKIDRNSYETLVKAVMKKRSGIAAPHADASSAPTTHASAFPASPRHEPSHFDEPVRAERRSREHDGTRMRAAAGPPQPRPAYDAPETNPLIAAAGAASTPDTFDQLTNPSRWPHEASQTVGTGTVLKERFVLESIIGRGGMGTIFRARDLRKEEAQDRHPYVAVKVLNEDFRKHPEALKSLQRESRKAQSLAHPNVATVFDFDRDGSVVYLVMELLEGMSLDQFIKSRVGRPLPQAEAMRIVEGLCAALAHAHQKGLVHADFKPANAFRTHDGAVKVLDFGIARAIGHRTHDSDRTLFDPASLGALTPCYASPEMLVGDPPDPRDDVYALACVSYELFCSRHPFDFTSSLQAERRNMKPAPIPGLDRRIWRGLVHGLAFSRANRTPSVEAFLAEIVPTHRFRFAASAFIVAAIVALVAVLWNVVPDFLRDQAYRRYSTQLRSGDDSAIDDLIPRLVQLPTPQRRALFDDVTLQDALLDHMNRKILAVTNPSNEQVDYAAAARDLDQLDKLLPDSTRVGQMRADVEASKRRALAAYVAAVPEQIKQGWLVDTQNPDNVMRTISRARQIDPQWQPDTAALGLAFNTQIRRALYVRNDAALAAQLLGAAREVVPTLPELASLESAIRQHTATVASVSAASAPVEAKPVETQSVVAARPAAVASEEKPVESKVAETKQPEARPSEAVVPTVSTPPRVSGTATQRKERLLALAAADDIPEALELYRNLQSELAGDDTFLTGEAPDALAQSYIRLSKRAFETGEFESSAALLTRAAEFAPNSTWIASRRESVDRLGHLAHTIDNVVWISPEAISAELEHVQLNEPERYPIIRAQLADAFARRVTELAASSPQRANELLKVGKKAFPGSAAFDDVRAGDELAGAGPG